MAGPTIDSFLQVMAPTGAPATAQQGPNTRVLGRFGPAATVVDLVLMPPPFTFARWLVGNARTLAGGVAMVSQGSVGIVYASSGAPAPPVLTAADTRLITT